MPFLQAVKPSRPATALHLLIIWLL